MGKVISVLKSDRLKAGVVALVVSNVLSAILGLSPFENIAIFMLLNIWLLLVEINVKLD